MVLKKLKDTFKQRSTAGETEEYIEVDVGGTSGSSFAQSKGKIGIRIESLDDFSETEKVIKFLREGSIVMLKIKTLKEKDLSELKRAVERIKRTVLAQNGDLVGIDQDWLLVVPEHVMVHR